MNSVDITAFQRTCGDFNGRIRFRIAACFEVKQAIFTFFHLLGIGIDQLQARGKRYRSAELYWAGSSPGLECALYFSSLSKPTIEFYGTIISNRRVTGGWPLWP